MQEQLSNSVLSVKVGEEFHGIQLSWNFPGVYKKDVYFHHLLISQASNLKLFETFAEDYFARIKPGDILSAVTPFDENIRPKWAEKSAISSSKDLKHIYDLTKNEPLDEILKQLTEYTDDFSRLLIVNIIYDSETDLKNLRKLIDNLRKEGHYKFVFNIFGQFPNFLDNSEGVNLINLQQFSQSSFGLIKWLTSQISVLNSSIDIECLNGEINVQSMSNWSNSDFRQIGKKYIGISNHSITEKLHFVEGPNAPKKSILNIKIQFTLLNGKEYKACKVLELDSFKEKSLMRTACIKQPHSLYEICENFFVQRNPFEYQSYIVFTHAVQDNSVDPLL